MYVHPQVQRVDDVDRNPTTQEDVIAQGTAIHGERLRGTLERTTYMMAIMELHPRR